MANIISLGIHLPSALPFLIAEGILPKDPSPNEYQWQLYEDDEHNVDEVVTTDFCSVWSRGSVIQKVFRFDVEDQKIRHALLTCFRSEEIPTPAYESNPDFQGSITQLIDQNTLAKSPERGINAPRKSFTSSRAAWWPNEFSGVRPSGPAQLGQSRAFVVFLESQAHVFFLSGTSHIVHLPFKVDKVLPAPWGLVLQRELHLRSTSQATSTLPPAPPNSFLSSQLFPSQTSPILSQSQTSQALMFQFATHASESVAATKDDLPRLFTLTNPLSELGLVVSEGPLPSSAFSRSKRRGFKSPYEALDPAEEIIFVSPPHELSNSFCFDVDPLVIVVTLNRDSGLYTIWYALYGDSKPLSALKRPPAASLSKPAERRRSSFNPGAGTGRTTPAVRARDNLRESFAGDHRLPEPATASQRTATGESMPQSQSSQNAEDAFVSQVDPDFQGLRNPKRESRRISSFISRADLSTGPERSTFTDIASGHPQSSMSQGPAGRRGPSMGGQAERRSFGGLSSIRSRASTPGSTSRLSFLDDDLALNDQPKLPPQEFLTTDFGSLEFQEPLDSLPKEVAFFRIQTVSITNESSEFSQNLRAEKRSHSNVRVFTAQVPKSSSTDAKDNRGMNLYILDRESYELVIVGLNLKRMALQAVVTGKFTSKRQVEEEHYVMVPQVEEIQHLKGFYDIALLQTQSSTNILALTGDGPNNSIHLHDCNSFEYPLRLSIDTLKLFNPFTLAPDHSSSRREAGLKRTIKPENVASFRHRQFGGFIDIVEPSQNLHRLQIMLQPSSEFWNKVLEACRHVLPFYEAENIRRFWCAAHRWLMQKERNAMDLESMTTCITLFSMFVGGMEYRGKTLQATSQTRVTGIASGRKRAASQTSGKKDDPWSIMMDSEFQHTNLGSWNETAWSWAIDKAEHPPVSLRSPAKSTRAAVSTTARENPFIVDAIDLAQKFVTEDIWAKNLVARMGWTGQVSDEQRRHRNGVKINVLQSLHLLREEIKLNVLVKANCWREMKFLAVIIAQIGHWLNWSLWDWRTGNYYELEGVRASEWKFDNTRLSDTPGPAQSSPPLLLQWIEHRLAGRLVASFPTLDTLRDLARNPNVEPTSESYTCSTTRFLTPRSLAIITYLNDTELEDSPSFIHVERMAKYGIDLKMLETLPTGVAAALREHIVACQASPPTAWNKALLHLVGREDLHSLATENWNRHVDPVTISDNSRIAVSDMHSICRFTHHNEHHLSPLKEMYAISRLIFNEDKRYAEANDILEPLKPPIAECRPNPQWSEAEYLEAQKEVMQWVIVRTIALYPGSALIHFDGTYPMLTEKFHLSGFSTICVMKPLNNTVSADRSTLTEEKLSWAFFHAGVARGLSIAIEAEGIDTSWIVFNKPNELTNRHAGLLLALGLNGHLRHMAKWLAFKYLTPKHTMTSIGLLLGLSASFLGTMDQLVTRLLSVHVTRMLPEGAAELNVSPMTQTAGLMGIGLLYYDTQHRRMSEVMLSEIRHLEFEDPSSGSPDVLRDESYRLAAGFALGFINLAQGKNLGGLHNMGLVERLLEVAVGTKPVDAIHIMDQATAGATIAIGLIFMRSGDVALAKKIDIPDTLAQFDYVRPDLFLLRTLAKHLILWDNIKATNQWIKQNVLAEYKSMTNLSTINSLKSDHMPFFNTLAGLLWSIGLKYAGSGDIKVRDFLVGYLDQFIRLCKLPALRYDARLTRNTVRNCQDLLALAAATVMAGRGDLVVFRRLRLLHGRVHADTPYGSHLAAHSALGALFLGSGRYTFGTSKLATAALMCAFYPLFPTSVLDNKGHLQAFRHFWVFAAEARCLVVRDVDTHRTISLPITVIQHSGAVLHLQAPVLLPELDTIAQVKTNSPDYWQVTLDFATNMDHVASFKRNQTVFVRRRPASEVRGSTFHAALLALNDAQSSRTAKEMWDWIFNLSVFSSSQFSPIAFDRTDWRLVLPLDTHSSTNLEMKSTVVDTRLALSRSAYGWDHDDLMQLRILFTWAEKVAVEDGGRLRWLARSVIDGLKARVAQRVKELESEV